MRGVTGRWVRGLTDGRRLRGGVAGWWPRRRPTSDGRKDGWSSRLLHCAVAIIAWIAPIVDRNVKESVRDVLTKVSCMSLCVLVPSQ